MNGPIFKMLRFKESMGKPKLDVLGAFWSVPRTKVAVLFQGEGLKEEQEKAKTSTEHREATGRRVEDKTDVIYHSIILGCW